MFLLCSISHRVNGTWRRCVKINGETYYLWHTVDHEREAHETLVTKTPKQRVELIFSRKAMKRNCSPETIITDKLRSHASFSRRLNWHSYHLRETSLRLSDNTLFMAQTSFCFSHSRLILCARLNLCTSVGPS